MNGFSSTVGTSASRVNQQNRKSCTLRNNHIPNRWRCRGCGKVLGVRLGAFLEIAFTGGLLYRVSTPAMAICSRCHKRNELP